MSDEPTTTHPTHPGQVVIDTGRGRVGIVTERAREAGGRKGKISVMWIGGRYMVTEWPEELAVIDGEAVRTVAVAQAGEQS
jgi:hypothetical protein